MSWKDEDIDKLFQDASKEKTFEFKEEFWNEMEAMLPNKKKRKFPFIWVFSALIVCTGVIGVVSVQDHSANSIHTTNKSTIKTNNPETLAKTTTNTSTDKKQSTDVNQLIADNTTSKRTNNVSSKTSPEVTSVSSMSDKPLKNTSTIPVSILNQGTDGSYSNFNRTISSQTNAAEPIMQIHDKGSVDKLNLLSIRENDYTKTLAPGIIFGPAVHKWSIYFDLTTSMGQSPISSYSLGSNLSFGMGLGAGINYSTGSWNLNAGLSTSFTSFDNLYVKERVKIYGFGVQNFDNEIQYKTLFNAELPLMAGFKAKNHTFQFGVVPSVLIGSKISFESKTNDEIYASSTVYGYRTGLANFGLKPTIGYMYKITPSLQIGGTIQMQVISPIVNNIYEGPINNLPINGQIFIRKSLFLK